MSTVHEAGARALYKRLMSDPQWADLINTWQYRLGSGEVPRSSLAVYLQPHFGGWTPDQIAAAVYLHTLVMDGTIAWKTYFIDDGPARDSARVENAAALTQLPTFLRARVDLTQNLADDDGDVIWDAPLEVNRSLAAVDADGELLVEQILLPAWQVPLEIGSTMASKTLEHVMWRRGVARWPYGCDYVQVLFNLGPSAQDIMQTLLADDLADPDDEPADTPAGAR